jgi:hypothetical protein
MRDGPIGSDHFAVWLDDNADAATQHLFTYFGGDPGVTYQGRYFESFQQSSTAGSFTAEDFLAIGALSVTVPAQTAHRMITDASGAYRQLLSECQHLINNAPGADLATCPEPWLFDDASPFVKLYHRLRRESGCGPVVTSKLLAAKYPSLIPIRDSRVEWLLDLSHRSDWWKPMRELFAATAATLTRLTGTGSFDHVVALRRLDVVLWMEASKRGSADGIDSEDDPEGN